MADHKKPLAVVADGYVRGYEWCASQYDARLHSWNMSAAQVRDRDGLVIEAQLVTKFEHMEGREFRSYVIVGSPATGLVEAVKARVR